MCVCERTVWRVLACLRVCDKGRGKGREEIKEDMGIKREGGEEGMVRKKEERWRAIKRPINLLNECPSSRGDSQKCSLLRVHQSQV